MKLNIHQFLSAGFLFQKDSQLPSETFCIGWGSSKYQDFRTNRPQVNAVSIYAPDFFLTDSKPWWCFSEHLRVKRTDLIEELKSFLLEESSDSKNLNFFPPALNSVKAPSFDQFSQVYHELQNEFRMGNLKKAVPVIFESALLEMSLRTRALLLLQLLSRTENVPVYPYGVWSEDEGVLGATPEVLFSQETSDVLQTVALAGTRLNGSLSLSLLGDPKELEEHQIVIDGISTSLQTFGKIEVGVTRELQLPTLSHLMTPIQLRIEQEFKGEVTLEKWVDQLHPTPALGAFPKQSGWDWLKKFQTQVDRMRHGAPFGIQGAEGEKLCVVGIRNIQWKNNKVWIGAGCGLISASQLEKEWLEIQGKIRSIKKLVGWET